MQLANLRPSGRRPRPKKRRPHRLSACRAACFGCGGRIWTCDLRVMRTPRKACQARQTARTQRNLSTLAQPLGAPKCKEMQACTAILVSRWSVPRSPSVFSREAGGADHTSAGVMSVRDSWIPASKSVRRRTPSTSSGRQCALAGTGGYRCVRWRVTWWKARRAAGLILRLSRRPRNGEHLLLREIFQRRTWDLRPPRPAWQQCSEQRN